MPPKPKITKDMILNTVLKITREMGFEAVNARSVAGRLECSTRPIFTCYKNMEELKKDFLDFVFEYYSRYAAEYRKAKTIKPYLFWPLSYIEFAKEETNLFKLLFINDMELDMAKAEDFYKELENEEKANEFSEMIGVRPEGHSGSTDCNIPFSLGINSLCFGGYLGEGAHTREEKIEKASLLSGLGVMMEFVLDYFL